MMFMQMISALLIPLLREPYASVPERCIKRSQPAGAPLACDNDSRPMAQIVHRMGATYPIPDVACGCRLSPETLD